MDEYGNQTQHRKISPKEWNNSYNESLKDLPVNRSIPPEGLVSIKVNKTSGLRSANGSSNSLFEYFLEEYVPE